MGGDILGRKFASDSFHRVYESVHALFWARLIKVEVPNGSECATHPKKIPPTRNTQFNNIQCDLFPIHDP